MRKLILILFFLPLLSIGQHYQAGSGSTPSTGWTPPAAWVDSTGAITTSVMGADGTLAASTIKILVDTRMANRTIAFTVTAANGYTVNWGRKESGVNYANGALAERTYDSTKCQRYCVITITKTGAGAITAFTVSRSITYVATQVQYPQYLWIAANYSGAAPVMYLSTLNCYNLMAAYLMTVTSIGAYCFQNCYALSSVTIPSSVTSLGSQCFLSCSALQSITIPSSVTSLGTFCFFSCGALQSITILSSVISIGAFCFSYCYALQSVTIPSGTTSIPASMFTGDVSLKNVTYTGTETSAEDQGSDFMQGCEQLDTVSMKGVKSQRFACYGASGELNKLGGIGNLHNDSIPIRLNWAASTFANASAPQLNLSYCSMTELQIRAILNCLPTVVGKTVTVVGCKGAAALTTADKANAVAKGWTVLN
jgi:hypothetical protein